MGSTGQMAMGKKRGIKNKAYRRRSSKTRACTTKDKKEGDTDVYRYCNVQSILCVYMCSLQLQLDRNPGETKSQNEVKAPQSRQEIGSSLF